jgi:phage terminase large subunit-like protein
MMDNVDLFYDSSGNMKPDKKKSTDKIDGVVATIMALGGLMTEKGDTLQNSFIASGAFMNMEEFKKQAANETD